MYGLALFGDSNYKVDNINLLYFKGEERSGTLTAKVHASPSLIYEPSLDITDIVTNYQNPLIAYRPVSTDFITPIRLDYTSIAKAAVESVKFARQCDPTNIVTGKQIGRAHV